MLQNDISLEKLSKTMSQKVEQSGAELAQAQVKLEFVNENYVKVVVVVEVEVEVVVEVGFQLLVRVGGRLDKTKMIINSTQLKLGLSLT